MSRPGWNSAPLKHLAQYQNGFAFKPEHRGDHGRPIIRIAQLTSDEPAAYYDGPVDPRVVVHPGDLLFSWSATLDSFLWDGPEALLNQHIFRVTPAPGVDKRFLYYALKSVVGLLGDHHAHGSTMTHIKREDLSHQIPVPHLEEQRRIAAFLDYETTRIDQLVRQQERFVCAVEQKLRSVTRQLVTRGLDEGVSTEREARVQWLGPVPTHWNVAPLKYLVRFISGNTPTRDVAAYWNGDTPWVSAKDMKVLDLYGAEDQITELAIAMGGARVIHIGAVVVVVRGMILAHTLPVAVSRVPLSINQDLKALIPGPRIVPEFLRDYLLAVESESLGRVEEAGHGTKALRMDKWVSLEVPIPPIAEQLAIAAHIDHERREANELLEAARTLRHLLLERRAALVTTVVTGQIDVRTWTPPDDWLAPEAA